MPTWRLSTAKPRTSPGINNAETWTPSQATQADFQDLPDGGYVMGLVGGEYGVVFQERSIKRMTYVGVPLVFQFDEVARGIGTPAEGSVARYEDMAFFLSDEGFYVLSGAQQLRGIGQNKIDRYFWNDVNSEPLAPHQQCDRSRQQTVCGQLSESGEREWHSRQAADL